MNNKKVKILWLDAKMYSPNSQEITISKMETVGELENEDDIYIIIKNSKTINLRTGESHPKENPAFYSIPKRLVEKLEYL